MHQPGRNFLGRHVRRYVAGLLLFVIGASTAAAETTALAVRVRADDAKFIGTGTGGLNVIIEDATTGALLASGRIEGATGDTATLMKTGQTRGHSPTAGSAEFLASLDIAAPTRVRIHVTGPLAEADSIQALSATTWVIPGKDMLDPGIVLNMPGLLVALADLSTDGTHIDVGADVTMMCGCPITAGGLWDAADYEVVGVLYLDGKPVTEAKLGFTGDTNRFRGKLEAPGPGVFELVVHAFQDSRDNVGVARQAIVLR